jgi:sugar/nucleoside kinase (ribokinase family)
MDLFALGTPVIDLFAKVGWKELAALGLEKGATNYRSALQLADMERRLSKKTTYRYPGDNARNVCEGFAALGGFCGYAGAVGSDSAASEFEGNLASCGIAPFLQRKKGSTGKILALITPGGQRTFCADLGVTKDCDRLEKIACGRARMLFLTSITLGVPCATSRLAQKYLELAKRQKKKIALSLESPPMVGKNREKFAAIAKKYADVLFMNEEEAGALLGKGFGRKLASFKPSALVYLKMGKRGSALFHKGKKTRMPSLPAKALDTTGAGDAYAAGVLYGLSRSYTPVSSAKIGCMLATKVVQKLGAGIPHQKTRIRIRHG